MRPTSRIAAIIPLAAVTLLLAALPWLHLPVEWRNSTTTSFLGRFHIVLLHFPLVLILVALVASLRTVNFPVLRRVLPEIPRAWVTTVVGAAALAAAFTALAGWLLAQVGKYGPLLPLHLWTGSGVAVTAMLAWLLHCTTAPRATAGALALSAALLLPAGHAGGGLTHGETFLSAYAPSWLKPLLGPMRAPSPTTPATPPTTPASPSAGSGTDASKLVFRDVIFPVLDRHCTSCHGETKTKGKLRADTRDAILHGGEDGPAAIAGDAAHSLLLKRMRLPLDDDDHMPPEDPDRVQPTAAEIALLEWWVNAGMPGNVPLTEISVPLPDTKAPPTPRAPAAYP